MTLDEYICSLNDARKLIEIGTFDIINIKLSKCGGLIRSKEIADLAHSHNIECQLGAHVGETAMLSTAGIHFAMTVQNISHFAGTSFLLFRDLYQTMVSDEEDMNDNYAVNRFGLGMKSGHDTLLEDSRLVVSVDHNSLKKAYVKSGVGKKGQKAIRK
ncbi:enolase C-terminal domain-like protein [Thermodesulfobacteriota bacterium]